MTSRQRHSGPRLRIPHLEQPPRRDRPGLGMFREPGTTRLRRLPPTSWRSEATTSFVLAVGAFQVAGGRGRFPPVHDASAVGVDRAEEGIRWQAEVRPHWFRPGVLRPTPRPRHRGGRPGHLHRGDVLRGVALHLSPAPDQRRGPSLGRPRGRGSQRGGTNGSLLGSTDEEEGAGPTAGGAERQSLHERRTR
jgi:hypothetical protein